MKSSLSRHGIRQMKADLGTVQAMLDAEAGRVKARAATARQTERQFTHAELEGVQVVRVREFGWRQVVKLNGKSVRVKEPHDHTGYATYPITAIVGIPTRDRGAL